MSPIDEVDDDEIFDVEPGVGVQLHAPHPHFVSFCSMTILTLCFVSYYTEYVQEMHAIAALKQATPLTDACLDGYTAESFSWFHRVLWHASGLHDIEERECWNQRRVASMLNYPNPLHCLINLVWKAFIGQSPLGDIFSRQSYIVQCTLIIAAAIIVGLLVYNFALKLPSFFTTLVQLPDLHRREQFEEMQQRIREEALSLPPAARTAYKRARDARKQKQRDWKLAAYAWMIQQQSKK